MEKLDQIVVKDMTRRPHRDSGVTKASAARRGIALAAGGLSLLCALAGGLLAWQYPLGAAWMLGSFALVMAVAAGSPIAWIALIPALLPLSGLAPCTGWIMFEEFDMLILAAAAGGYARLAWVERSAIRDRISSAAPPVLLWLVMVLFSVSTLIAMARGFNDAGGFSFAWFQGYQEPMNSARLGKSILFALLLLPLWRAAHRAKPVLAARALTLGMILGLGIASLAAVWERLAFTGLFDFSSDYRTTSLFWEMHVGGAAFDSFLALTVPFVAKELIQARTTARWLSAATIAALAGYACLTTFSRGVFLAVPLGLAVFLSLQALQQARAADVAAQNLARKLDQTPRLTGAVLLAIFGGFTVWIFRGSGYRGAGALLGALALLLPLTSVLRTFARREWIIGAVAGLLLAGMCGAIASFVPKGAYLAYALAFGISATMLWAYRRGHPVVRYLSGPTAFAGFVATLLSLMLVADHWGGTTALRSAIAAVVACLMLALIEGSTHRPMWPDSLRWHSSVIFLLGLTIVAIGVFSGGSYMEGRFATGERDLDGRLAHWKLSTNMLHTPSDWWFGKGLGRFPANYVLVDDPKLRPGDYRLLHSGQGNYLRLAGGRHVNGWGEMFRIAQRIEMPPDQLMVGAQVRTAMDAVLHFEVCEQHLLYNLGCKTKSIVVKANPDAWQHVDAVLQGAAVSRGPWYAPRLISFAVAMNTRGGVADLNRLTLTGPDGQNLLQNGDFSREMAHWFPVSEKWHLPWHAKNMFLHVLLEQGLVGLALWTLLLAGTLIRLTVGDARRHPLAPALAGGLAGFAIVGLFDSLLDVPRIATLFYFMVLLSFTMGRQERRHMET